MFFCAKQASTLTRQPEKPKEKPAVSKWKQHPGLHMIPIYTYIHIYAYTYTYICIYVYIHMVYEY
jgi:hypothetical protein